MSMYQIEIVVVSQLFWKILRSYYCLLCDQLFYVKRKCADHCLINLFIKILF